MGSSSGRAVANAGERSFAAEASQPSTSPCALKPPVATTDEGVRSAGADMSACCIKGSAFQAVVDDLQRLRETGALSESEIQSALAAPDLALLDAGVLTGSWYPVDSYRKMLELLTLKEGRFERDVYLRRRGTAASERILNMGLYTHLQDAIRAVERQPTKWVEQVGRIMITLSNAMFNFSSWKFVAPSARKESGLLFTLNVSAAEELPEVTRIVLEGFIESLFKPFTQEKIEVRSRRPAPGTILYEGFRQAS